MALRIERHCHERLPRGERFWRALAREAGFDGRLIVTGIGQRRWSRAELTSTRRGRYGVMEAWFEPGRITVFVEAPCAAPRSVKRPRLFDPVEAFAHELGHARRYARTGQHEASPVKLADHRADPEERFADRYGRALVARVTRRMKGGSNT